MFLNINKMNATLGYESKRNAAAFAQPLFNRYRLGQIFRFVDIAAVFPGHVIGQQLQRYNFHHCGKQGVNLRDKQQVIGNGNDLLIVPEGQGQHFRAPGLHFHDIAQGLFHDGGIAAQGNDRLVLFYQGDGPVL